MLSAYGGHFVLASNFKNVDHENMDISDPFSCEIIPLKRVPWKATAENIKCPTW